MTADALSGSMLWWQGPSWLSLPPSQWPTFPSLHLDNTHNQRDRQPPILTALHAHFDDTIMARFSSLTRLLRVIARCLRFKKLLMPDPQRLVLLQQSLSAEELQRAFLACVYYSQSQSFKSELETLKRQNLHGNCRLAALLIDWAHRSALHGGFQLTYAYAVRRAWLIRGRVRVKAHIRACVTCARHRAQSSEQLMGNLPAERVTPSFPFERTGVNYAGPFAVKRTVGRGLRSVKGYVALFVCLTSKSVHLEVVGDLSTQSFLGALRRFVGRRGTPCEIWSDNATTFHGADAELRSMLREAELDWEIVQGTLANQQIKWSFIPPSAPHFGGLWEANIKSAKATMKKIIGSRSLTYEELSTLVIEIESCMNSRPLLPITGEPDDLDCLTPGHSLIGRQLQQLPEPSSSDRDVISSTHWRLIKALRDQFWKRWSREYLHTLQQRNKWINPKRNLQVGDLVLIVDPSLLRNGRWPLGRIDTVNTGSDGFVRSASIRTVYGTYTRPVVKLCLLPSAPEH